MIPKPFEYSSPASVSEAIRLPGKDDDAKILAGGQSHTGSGLVVTALGLILAPCDHLAMSVFST